MSYLSMLIRKLECLDQPQSFIHISPHWEVIDSDLSQGAATINDKQASECKTLILLEDPIGPADDHALVCQQGDLHVPQPSRFAALLTPGQVGEVGVSGAGDDSAVEGFKLCNSVREGDDLRRADEGEVEGIEEEDNILALVVIQGDLLELTVHNCSSLEFGSSHLRLESHGECLKSEIYLEMSKILKKMLF